MHETNGDPQFTTQGVYRQAEPIYSGPGEGQGGERKRAAPPTRKPRRKTIAARRGKDETPPQDRSR